MGKLGTSKLDVEKVKELHLQGKNDKEIAVLLNASPSTVCYVRKSILKLKPVIETIELTKEQEEILKAIQNVDGYHIKCHNFGKGNSTEKFLKILENEEIWDCGVQKTFVDL